MLHAWHGFPEVKTTRSSSNLLKTKCHLDTDTAATLLGCVTPMTPFSANPALYKNCAIFVVFPEPVAPITIVVLFCLTFSTISSSYASIGSLEIDGWAGIADGSSSIAIPLRNEVRLNCANSRRSFHILLTWHLKELTKAWRMVSEEKDTVEVNSKEGKEFSEGEKVLAYHGPLIYQAKVSVMLSTWIIWFTAILALLYSSGFF